MPNDLPHLTWPLLSTQWPVGGYFPHGPRIMSYGPRRTRRFSFRRRVYVCVCVRTLTFPMTMIDVDPIVRRVIVFTTSAPVGLSHGRRRKIRKTNLVCRELLDRRNVHEANSHGRWDTGLHGYERRDKSPIVGGSGSAVFREYQSYWKSPNAHGGEDSSTLDAHDKRSDERFWFVRKYSGSSLFVFDPMDTIR